MRYLILGPEEAVVEGLDAVCVVLEIGRRSRFGGCDRVHECIRHIKDGAERLTGERIQLEGFGYPNWCGQLLARLEELKLVRRLDKTEPPEKKGLQP